jgi:hypothetical protein
MPNDAHQPLSYESPVRESQHSRGARQQFAGFFAILAMLFGAPFMSAGFGYFFQAFRLSNHGARNEAFFFSAIGFGVGGVCAIAAFRWGREWHRRRGGR